MWARNRSLLNNKTISTPFFVKMKEGAEAANELVKLSFFAGKLMAKLK